MTAFICLLIGACLGVFAMCLAKTSARSETTVADMEVNAALAYCELETDRDLWRSEALAARQKEEEAVNG
jgi:hypothetical protein